MLHLHNAPDFREQETRMAGKVVTVAQQKGGAGKTTLLAHLAVAFRRRGLAVAALDADPQGSLSLWARQREANGLDDLTVLGGEGLELTREAARLKRAHDLVLIDSPPHTQDAPQQAIAAADLVLVPVQPSPMDLWATRPTLVLAAKAKKPILLVLNRMPPRGRLADEIAGLLASFQVPIAATRLGNRAAFAAALSEGRAVGELAPRGQAAREIQALAEEVGTRLGL
jgi:chromosome partitioning protein